MMSNLEEAVIIQKLADINIAWCENEKSMAEFAALEVACENHGVDSQWFYDSLNDSRVDAMTKICQKVWGKK